ncbi:PREDICTED: putative purine permease 15 [Camelina sativa]|uniref:Probable purine permease n=1 Tax=Camelina sativa TaxID=90675 RepID=A0ABM0SUS4_CAMSA|nr:PREDICTED: putative purine permease 15 [Camelina sativa]
MVYNQPMQSNSQEQFVQVPLYMEHGSSTPINQTSDSNQRLKKWVTIIICIILAVTGQCIVRILENYYFLHRNRSRRYSFWTQSLLQVIGFPILLIPFLLLLLSSKKRKQLLVTSAGITVTLIVVYPIIVIYMFFQAFFSNIKHRIPFKVFTLIYTSQLFFTPIFSIFIFTNRVKFNIWMILSLILATLAGTFTLYTFSAGSPIIYNGKIHNFRVMYVALCAAGFFSLLLSQIRSIFEAFISVCKESTNIKQPSFVVVLELLIFSFLYTTVIFVAAVFISGDHHNLKREMDGFSKGQVSYVWTMVGQAVAWQIYWVGIVGLVLAVSAVFSNVISVCTWPIVSVLVALFYNKYDQFDVFRGIALGAASLSVASYLYMILKEKSEDDDQPTS